MNETANPAPVPLESLRGATGLQTIALCLVLSAEQGRDQSGQPVPMRGGAVEVKIDGVPLDCGDCWDLLALVASGREPGGYYLGNCDCGEPMCASIRAPMEVRHDGERIVWTVPIPYTRRRGGHSEDSILLTFDASQYRTQTEGLLAEFRRAAGDGGPRIDMECYPGNLPQGLLEWADKGGAGYGGCEVLPDE